MDNKNVDKPTPNPHGEFKYLPSLPPAPIEEIIELQKERENEHLARMRRKLDENPFVPIGCMATAGILTWGLISMKQGNHRRSQLLMRARVVAQGITVAFLLGGALVYAGKK